RIVLHPTPRTNYPPAPPQAHGLPAGPEAHGPAPGQGPHGGPTRLAPFHFPGLTPVHLPAGHRFPAGPEGHAEGPVDTALPAPPLGSLKRGRPLTAPHVPEHDMAEHVSGSQGLAVRAEGHGPDHAQGLFTPTLEGGSYLPRGHLPQLHLTGPRLSVRRE